MMAAILSFLMFAVTATSTYGSSVVLESSLNQTLVFLSCMSSIVSLAAMVVNIGILTLVLTLQSRRQLDEHFKCKCNYVREVYEDENKTYEENADLEENDKDNLEEDDEEEDDEEDDDEEDDGLENDDDEDDDEDDEEDDDEEDEDEDEENDKDGDEKGFGNEVIKKE
jgi:hypothetical protein